MATININFMVFILPFLFRSCLPDPVSDPFAAHAHSVAAFRLQPVERLKNGGVLPHFDSQFMITAENAPGAPETAAPHVITDVARRTGIANHRPDICLRKSQHRSPAENRPFPAIHPRDRNEFRIIASGFALRPSLPGYFEQLAAELADKFVHRIYFLPSGAKAALWSWKKNTGILASISAHFVPLDQSPAAKFHLLHHRANRVNGCQFHPGGPAKHLNVRSGVVPLHPGVGIHGNQPVGDALLFGQLFDQPKHGVAILPAADRNENFVELPQIEHAAVKFQFGV